MSHSSNDSSTKQQFLHIKVIEVDFKGNRPGHTLSVKFKVGEDVHDSPLFKKQEAVLWKEYIHFSASEDFIVLVQEVHRLRPKNKLVIFNIKSTDITGKESFSTEDSKGRAILKLTCVPVLPTDEFAELIVKEAQGQLDNKKTLLGSLGKAGKALAVLMKFTDVASNVNSGAKAAAIAVNLLYERCKTQQGCHDDAVKLMEDLATFLPFTKDMPHDLMKNDNTTQTVEQMAVLGDLLSSAKEEIDACKAKYGRLKDTYNWWVKIETWRSAIKLEMHAEDQQLKELFLAKKSFYNIDNKCLEGTRSFILEQVMQWADSDSKLFWLHGLAGSGKSTIANSVAHIFNQQNRLSGCFFCKRDDPECRTPKNVLPTLAYYLAKWHHVYRRAVLSVLQGDDQPKLTQSLQWQFDLLIKQPLASWPVTPESLPPKPLIIVIDALDECEDADQSWTELSQLLTRLAGASPWIKVFITSRSLPEFQRVFLQHENDYKTLNISSDIVEEDVQEDLLQYTRLCAEKLSYEKDYLLSEEQIKSFTDKASGLFIWISTVFRFINSQNDINWAIEKILSQAALDGQIEGLNQMYTTVIRSLHGGPRNAELLKAVLGVIVCTSKNTPLPEDALAYFLPQGEQGVGLDSVKHTITSLHAVLYRDLSKGGVIRVCHPSFLDFISNGRHVVTGSEDGIICIWDAQTGDAVGQPLRGHSYQVISVAYSPDGKYIVSGSYDNALHIWDAQSGNAVGEPLRGHSGPVWSVAYSPDGKNIVSGSHDSTLCIWNIQNGNAVGKPLKGHSGTVYSASYSPDGKNIVSGSHDSTLCIWNIQNGKTVGEPLRGHSGPVYSVAYSPDGRNIVSGSFDNTLIIWDAQNGNAVGKPLRGHSSPVCSIAYSPDGKNIVLWDGTLCIWDAQSGNAVSEPFRGHSGPVYSAAYSPDGRNIVSGSYDNTLIIWDAQSGNAVGEPLRGHSGLVTSVAYSPDGKNIVSGSYDNTLIIWDAQNRSAVGIPLRGHSSPVQSVSYSLDGKSIVSGSHDFTLCVWDAQSGNAVGEPLSGHSGPVNSVAYSPDGKNIVSGSHDSTLRIWNIQNGNAIGKHLKGHSGTVTSVAYSPDGKNIVSGSDDNTLCIWDAQSGNAVGEPLSGHSGPVYSISYSPDGMDIVSGSYDGTLCLWDAQNRNAADEISTSHADQCQFVASGSDDGTASTGGLNMCSPESARRQRFPLKLSEDGWCKDSDGRLLLWVPPEYHIGVRDTSRLVIPADVPGRQVTLDITKFEEYVGSAWVNILKDPNFTKVHFSFKLKIYYEPNTFFFPSHPVTCIFMGDDISS
ncbi:hypothetical protein EW145_g4969 [Phellinidium pouzarii]|uniref:Nephrocystin 3-like N-terminal domain-containing protein n=1 Tax=Phellinidium pouzarii TaxID=167371 RepID=A0A4S4L6H4_9AGAM|nr:hypothetical protein EW145_g4969 [Phellinidium pouzarii]